MAINPRRLRPSELTRLLNSTPLGEVIDERSLRRHITRAGFLITSDGDPGRIDILRYLSWLIRVAKTKAKPTKQPAPARLVGYEAIKERSRQRNASLSLSGRDIGAIPEVVNQDRKEQAGSSLRAFCESYLSRTFSLPWSEDHLRVIAKIEQTVIHGGLCAMAMPRGSGKSSICEAACLWAVLYGLHTFVVLIGADKGHAEGMLESIKSEIENNDLLLADHPAVCFPVRALDGINNKAPGQLYRGARTNIGWTAGEIVLPTIEGSIASGAILRVTGLTGGIRGMKAKRIDGTTVRPSLVLIDDPQTDESAASPTQCAQREYLIQGAILGLAGPTTKIAALATLTVIRADDLSDRLLDRDRNPEWHGERTKAVYEFPKATALWDEYIRIWEEEHRTVQDTAAATEFYRANRAEMDAGARVAWPERFNRDEISGIQHCMTHYLRKPSVFAAEYQNEPVRGERGAPEALKPDEICAKVNRRARGLVPAECTHLTQFIDVQKRALPWMVVAWLPGFGGAIVDYGMEPEQRTRNFTLADLRRTLDSVSNTRAGMEASIYEGLDRLCGRTTGVEWRREDGTEMLISQCLIDSRWGLTTDLVYRFCRQSRHAPILMPSEGYGITASGRPINDWPRRPGERRGPQWVVRRTSGDKRQTRKVSYDANHWKSFVASRLAAPMGDPGGITLYGDRADEHVLLADHFTAEYRVRTSGRGRSLDEWKIVNTHRDNHWWDCLVGCAVAASMVGIATAAPQDEPKPKRRRLTLAEMQARARESQAVML